MKKIQHLILVLIIGTLVCADAFADARSEALAFYRERKKELIGTFTPPEKGTDITVTLKSGITKTGKIASLTKQMLTIEGDDLTFTTLSKDDLAPESQQILFAAEYADAKAKEEAREYAQELRKKNAAKRKEENRVREATLRVSYDVDKGKPEKDEQSEEYDHSNGETYERSVTVKTTSETPTLKIIASNKTKHEDEFTLEWYFILKPVQQGRKGDPACFEKGSETIKLGPGQQINRTITAKKILKETEVEQYDERDDERDNAQEKKRKGKNKDKKRSSGDVAEGYVVLIKHGDEIIDKKSNENIYISDVWLLEVLPRPVAALTAPPSIPQLKNAKK